MHGLRIGTTRSRFVATIIIERIIYLALKQISVLYLALENLNFSICNQVKISFLKWHCRPFRTVTVSSGWQNNINTLVCSGIPWCQIGKDYYSKDFDKFQMSTYVIHNFHTINLHELAIAHINPNFFKL